MVCQKCGRSEATVHLESFVFRQKIEEHLCPLCAGSRAPEEKRVGLWAKAADYQASLIWLAKLRRLQLAQQTLLLKLGHEATAQEIAAEIEWPLEEVERLIEMVPTVVRLAGVPAYVGWLFASGERRTWLKLATTGRVSNIRLLRIRSEGGASETCLSLVIRKRDFLERETRIRDFFLPFGIAPKRDELRPGGFTRILEYSLPDDCNFVSTLVRAFLASCFEIGEHDPFYVEKGGKR
jgi:hypothetical protein